MRTHESSTNEKFKGDLRVISSKARVRQPKSAASASAVLTAVNRVQKQKESQDRFTY